MYTPADGFFVNTTENGPFLVEYFQRGEKEKKERKRKEPEATGSCLQYIFHVRSK
jgi:hypothetical protein